MEAVEIVIKIPKDRYETLVEINNRIKDGKSTVKLGMNMYEEAIANGAVLPEGHGKLITEPTDEEIAKTIGGQNDFAECIREAVKAVFDNAPAVIESDKEIENE